MEISTPIGVCLEDSTEDDDTGAVTMESFRFDCVNDEPVWTQYNEPSCAGSSMTIDHNFLSELNMSRTDFECDQAAACPYYVVIENDDGCSGPLDSGAEVESGVLDHCSEAPIMAEMLNMIFGEFVEDWVNISTIAIEYECVNNVVTQNMYIDADCSTVFNDDDDLNTLATGCQENDDGQMSNMQVTCYAPTGAPTTASDAPFASDASDSPTAASGAKALRGILSMLSIGTAVTMIMVMQ